MKKIFISILVLIAWTVSLSAQVTREQANVIVWNYVQSEVTNPSLYANLNAPNDEGIIVTTSNEEAFKAKYACWAYCLDENESSLRRYLFVKEEGGSLLEVIASNDQSVLDNSWEAMDTPTGLTGSKGGIKQHYPNPVDDLLALPCNGETTHVEIYDLKGTNLFSGLLAGKDNCQLNVSFLNTGVYMVNVSGETFKIIKK